MIELFYNSFATANLFLSIFLVLVLIYWLSVVLGALDMNSIDVDVDIETDLHVDKNIDIPVGESGGFMLGILRFFNLGQVPFMVLFSILILSMWSISVSINKPASWFNPEMSAGWALVWLMPNFIVSLFITKFISLPLVPLFRALDSSKAPIDVRGHIATLMTQVNKDEVGQAKVEINGSVMTISVKNADEKPIERGAPVIIVEEIQSSKIFIVQRHERLD